jgi:hypothetical protein
MNLEPLLRRIAVALEDIAASIRRKHEADEEARKALVKMNETMVAKLKQVEEEVMQLHHVAEYNFFSDLAERAAYWGELLVGGHLLLVAAAVVVPVAVVVRAARGLVRWATAPYWFEPEPVACERGLHVAR